MDTARTGNAVEIPRKCAGRTGRLLSHRRQEGLKRLVDGGSNGPRIGSTESLIVFSVHRPQRYCRVLLMEHMNWRLVSLVSIVVLAGCGSILDGDTDSNPDGPTETLTPAPVPQVTETPVPLPPGVIGSGIRDADALLDAHESLLRTQSYTLREQLRVDETHYTRLIRIETPTRYYSHDVLGGNDGNVTQFASGPFIYVRTEYAGITRYDRLDNTQPPESRTIRLSRQLLQVGDAAVSKTTVDDRPAFVVRGNYSTHPELERIRNVSLRAVVEPTGLVRSMNVSYVRTGGNGPATVTRSFAYDDVGETTVERPDWVETQWNGTTTPE